MGGQACILYGGAEFSRGIDFAVVASPENLDRLRDALEDLHAEVIAVPPFESRYLERGHAVHFRAHHPEVDGFRIELRNAVTPERSAPLATVSRHPAPALRRPALLDGFNFSCRDFPQMLDVSIQSTSVKSLVDVTEKLKAERACSST